jgi:hypothetical protein
MLSVSCFTATLLCPRCDTRAMATDAFNHPTDFGQGGTWCGDYAVRICRCFTASMTVIALLAGCATTLSDRAAKVADADEASVAGCGFVGQVKGYSGRGNLAASIGTENARNEARKQAAKLGATDIVWKRVSVSYSPYVSGVAYDCNSPRL